MMFSQVRARHPILAVLIGILVVASHGQTQQTRQPLGQVRLYVFDCGTLEGDPARYNLKREEVATRDMSVACYLIVHPRGTLMWDTGAVPDSEIGVEKRPMRHEVTIGNIKAYVTVSNTLKSQLQSAGFTPNDVNYLGLSHYHFDHTANSNDFAKSTWLVRQVERDGMFAAKPPSLIIQPATFSALRNSNTTILATDDHDVFGDGSVVIKWAPGHTPGHQMLFIRLAKTGPVLLSGDLYHYPEERTLGRLPVVEADRTQTQQTRAAIEAFLKATGAQLWIQHDLAANANLKKAPAYYD
jgi:N-acyl homoserine lactone hydrolase